MDEKKYTKKQICAAIVLATGDSVKALAAKHNYTKTAFYDAIRGRTKSRRIRNIIAEVLRRPVQEIWPPE